MKRLEALTDNTENLIVKLSTIQSLEQFVLVGGSALAIYLSHRQSEDLDFFTNTRFSFDLILDSVNSVSDNVLIIQKTRNQIDLKVENIKLTFCYQENNLLNNNEELIGYLKIASIETIVSLKLLTLFLRAKFRDYYDIYVICQHYGLFFLIDLGIKNIPNFNTKLIQNALTYVDDIEEDNIEYLNPTYIVSINEIKKYFVNQIHLLNGKI